MGYGTLTCANMVQINYLTSAAHYAIVPVSKVCYFIGQFQLRFKLTVPITQQGFLIASRKKYNFHNFYNTNGLISGSQQTPVGVRTKEVVSEDLHKMQDLSVSTWIVGIQSPTKLVFRKTLTSGELTWEGGELSTSTSVRPSVGTPRIVSPSLTGLLIPSAGSNTTASELMVLPRKMV